RLCSVCTHKTRTLVRLADGRSIPQLRSRPRTAVQEVEAFSSPLPTSVIAKCERNRKHLDPLDRLDSTKAPRPFNGCGNEGLPLPALLEGLSQILRVHPRDELDSRIQSMNNGSAMTGICETSDISKTMNPPRGPSCAKK